VLSKSIVNPAVLAHDVVRFSLKKTRESYES